MTLRFLALAFVLLACDVQDPVFYSGQFADSAGGACGGGGSTVVACTLPTPGVPGCSDPTVESCVCETNNDPYCCDIQWDQTCADEVQAWGCAGSGGHAGMVASDRCCPATPGQTGCADKAVEECVCVTHGQTSCCTVEWDTDCVEEVFNLGCTSLCGSSGSAGTAGSAGSSGLTCCPAHDGPGCDDPVVEACVCQPPFSDSICCTGVWDENCEEEARETYCQCGAGPQPPSPDQGDCCEETSAVGCTDPAIEACVCADPDGATCCTDTNVGWDSFCVDLVADLGCSTRCPVR